ncbi:MAG: DUF58 domain-containing protein [SAR202 cluster bacterium]|jgi:uncharacterized protein (DUF58 family)|nr:DUF58 domain-containing protein [Chloroflexota bacterium]MDP6422916.1 DUF58 domain-containing protein [SAR202 cluster bacterium]HAL48010.1 DUF58 domain-containing protein [Dehalococcoidia bacterium]MDP6665494.1 DUF58 domain-containing protein [SAR202 cluster bacterium]MDP6798288.1 DUF58 domain-containing protein [SAR202 cluster bacterium]|tara:strand:+ start:345 stop:1232 length:888 start_codon:yes stop_codon:yes gene_type:complete
MLSTELIDKIKRIEITARRLANHSFAGEYHSVFRGQGMEFDEIRPYVPGDDIRRIDWNVTARTAELHVRQFQEERELTVMLAVDASGSSEFGTIGQFKRELAAELAAVLSFAATINNDRVGLLIFTDQVEFLVPPRKGRRHALRMVRDLLVFEPKGTGTAINEALDTINLLLKRRGIVFLISDFLADPESFRRPLAATNQRHDLVAVDLHDPIERHIPDIGLIALEDAETGELDWVDTGSKSWREEYETRMDNLETEKRRMLASQGIDRIEVNTEKDYVPGLTRFFSLRTRRMAR